MHDVRMYWRGCRCDRCRAAVAAHERDRRRYYARYEDWVLDQRRHGTLAEYKRGCKCEACRGANARYVADRRA